MPVQPLDTPAGSTPWTPTERHLVRPLDEKKIGGVCAGVGHYLGVDVTLVRIVWLIVAIFTGAGFIVYLVFWAAMPGQRGTSAAQNA
ncbi:MAG TPA: PspC domain-containing protein [Bryobacteraceae bacterium]|nr:PspC domain-containing protein [Bryobacteraceae bacterium]